MAKSSEMKKAPILAGRISQAPNAERKQALDGYAAAMKLFQEGKKDKALAAFQKLGDGCPPDIAERVRVHILACSRQTKATPQKFESAQEECDYAVSLQNDGLPQDAKKHFDAVLAREPRMDYAMYMLAVLHSSTGNVEDALDMLSRAIEVNPANRLYARSDGDFQNIMDDPRFTELLYPEVS